MGLGYPFLCSLLPFHHPSWALASGVRTPLVRTKGAWRPATWELHTLFKFMFFPDMQEPSIKMERVSRLPTSSY